MNNLTSIYWIKNEARYIPEYVEFHLLQGFDKFIFYDNNSTDNLLEVIKPYNDLIEIRYYPENLDLGHNNRPIGSKNFYVMEYCIQEQCDKSKWIHYQALDERLFCPTGKLVIDCLNDYEQYGGLSVCGEDFNSNNHIKRPEGLIIENFTQTIFDMLYHIKTIIQPNRAVRTIGTPHNFEYKENYFSVNENFQRVFDSFCFRNHSYEKIKSHHYRTLSKEEFDIKMNKGVLDWKDTEDIIRNSKQLEWDTAHNGIIGENTELLKYVDIVRENIKKRYENDKHLLEYINH